ncbi:MAG: TolC family protein, partial [Lysobacter sp.]
AEARLRAARALHRVDGAQFRPQLGLRTSNPIDPDATASYLVAGFDSIWELGLFGRAQAMHRIVRGDLEAAQADVDEARVSVVAEVARDWITLRAARRRESHLARIRDLRARQAMLTGTRLQLHIASPLQVAQARIALAQADAALAEPRAAAASAAQALAVLLGRAEPEAAWAKGGALPVLQDMPVTRAPADLLRTRPDVAHAQAAVLGAAGMLGIAKANRYPTVAIGGSIVMSSSEASRRTTSTGVIGSIGPIIEIPLFDWGLRRAKAEAKSEDLQAAALAYRKTVLTAVAEVESVLAALEQQRMLEQDTLKVLRVSEEFARGAEHRERLGLGSGLDSAASNADREQAALDVDAARAGRALQYIALCKALGGQGQSTLPLPAAGER